MKRLSIFTFLFPPLALLVFIAPDVIRKVEFPPLDVLFPGILISYYVAIIPAWSSAAADYGMRQQAIRIVVTVIVGAITALFTAHFHGHSMSTPTEFMLVALMGAIPASVCSRLSGRAT